MAPQNYDCCGWVTKNDLRCSDGRTILRDAFAHQDGAKVPLVWNHNHSDPEEVLGYTLLENRPQGVYGYSYFNDTDKGQTAKALVEHGDIDSYSIFANHLKQNGNAVKHGMIKEVSLVLSAANPGACIEHISFAHGDDENKEEAVICTGETLELYHSDDDKNEVEKKKMSTSDKTVADVIATLNDEQKTAVAYLIGKAKEDGELKSVAEVLKTLNEDQKNAVAYIIGVIMQQAQGESDEDEEVQHSDVYDDYEGDYEEMKSNVFDNDSVGNAGYLTHSDMSDIIAKAKKSGNGTFMQVYKSTIEDMGLSHADGDSGIEYADDVQDYFVNDPSFLFPDAKPLNNVPEFIKRPTDWVNVVINGTKHTPFAKVKTMFANITADEARAKGYIKGTQKENEVITLLKRVTDATTVYKLQTTDRDDLIDITDFEPIAWLWGEMRLMLEEEIGRAILVGDGRLTSDRFHIPQDRIRPIWKDDSLFTIRKTVTAGTDVDAAKEFIKASIRARKDYRGSGNPILFTTEDWLTEMLLLEDGMGRALYETENALATKMRVSKIVTVPVMENLKNDGKDLMGIIVNLADYNIGTNKGGEITKFEDFDIDFNQNKLLIETRLSGALIKPYSAIVIERAASTSSASADEAQG